MFLVGVLAGVLVAGGVVLASGLATGISASYTGPQVLAPQSAGSVATMSSTTTVATTFSAATVTSVSSATTTQTNASVAYPAGSISSFGATVSNTTSAAAVNGQLSYMSGLQSSLTAQSPSRVSRILSAPFPSMVLLLPVVFALLLGFALYKASSKD